MKRIHLAAIALLLAAGFAIWWFSPTQVVKRRTKALLESISFSAGTSGAFRQMGGYKFGTFLADQVQLDTPHGEASGGFDRASLEAAYSSFAGSARESAFEVVEFHSVEVGNASAVVDATLFGRVEARDHRPVDGRYRARFQWQRERDGWKLFHASAHETP
jgi:hypothetical protein